MEKEIKVTGEHPVLALQAKKSDPPALAAGRQAGGLNSKLRGFFEGVWERMPSLVR